MTCARRSKIRIIILDKLTPQQSLVVNFGLNLWRTHILRIYHNFTRPHIISSMSREWTRPCAETITPTSTKKAQLILLIWVGLTANGELTCKESKHKSKPTDYNSSAPFHTGRPNMHEVFSQWNHNSKKKPAEDNNNESHAMCKQHYGNVITNHWTKTVLKLQVPGHSSTRNSHSLHVHHV